MAARSSWSSGVRVRDGLRHGFADQFVRVAEGNALLHQIVGEIGGQQHRIGRGGAAVVLAQLHGRNHFAC